MTRQDDRLPEASRVADPQPPQRVILTISDGIADVRLNRPVKANALDMEMFEAIADAIRELEQAKSLRAVVLSGEGRAFCAGLDVPAMRRVDARELLRDRRFCDANLVQWVAWGWRALPVPVVAAAHGVAFGGGFQILSGADIRIAHPATRCSIMEAKWGLVPDMAGFALWRTMARDDAIRELAWTAREFSGEEAHRLGLVTHLDAEPRARAMAIAHEIAGRNPDAVRAIKRLANVAAAADAATILRSETEEQLKILGSPNQLEAIAAVLQRRAPRFLP